MRNPLSGSSPVFDSPSTEGGNVVVDDAKSAKKRISFKKDKAAPKADTPATQAPPSKAAVRKIKDRERRISLTAFIFSPGLRLLLAFVLGGALVALSPIYQNHAVANELKATKASQAADNAKYQSEIDVLQKQCSDPAACKTFDFVSAEQVAQRYARACFSYYPDRPTGEQGLRLTAAGGPADCGWRNQGTGTALAVDIDSTKRSSIMDATNHPSRTMGIVGVTVTMSGEEAYPLSYIMVVQNINNAFSVVTPGALYTSAPTLVAASNTDATPTDDTVVQNCVLDATSAEVPKLTERLAALEAGRINTPNINPNDQLPDGSKLKMATFNKSITEIKVESVAVCRGTDPNNVMFLSHELFAGPTPNTVFEFTLAWRATRTDASARWSIAGWGPVAQANLASF